MKIDLIQPVLNRVGQPMMDNLNGEDKPATIGSLLLQLLDSPLPSDTEAGLSKRVQLSKIARNTFACINNGSDLELNSTEATLLLERASAFPIMSIVFEQIVDVLDPARWRD